MPIIKYIDTINRLYNSDGGAVEAPEAKAPERYNDKILKRDKYETPKKQIIKKTLIVEKPKPVKPPIIDYLELQDWLNEIDPQWWIDEKPNEKVLLQVPRRELKGLASILNLHKKLA